MSTAAIPSGPQGFDFELSVAASPSIGLFGNSSTRPSGPSASLESRWEGLQVALEEAVSDAKELGSDRDDSWRRGALGRGLGVLATLPASVDLPEIDVDSDGDVRFEWIGVPRTRVVLSINANNVVSFAAIWPGGSVHGEEVFLGGLPDVVWGALGRVGRGLRGSQELRFGP